jgi:hypothetical protein
MIRVTVDVRWAQDSDAEADMLEIKYGKAYSLNLLKGPKARMLSHGGAETSLKLKNARCEFA